MRPRNCTSRSPMIQSNRRGRHGWRIAAAARRAVAACLSRTAGATAPAGCAEPLEGRRLLSAGDLDPTFGAGGIRQYDPSLFTNGSAAAIPVQADGKLVAAGIGGSPFVNPDDAGFALARYLPDGKLDTTF